MEQAEDRIDSQVAGIPVRITGFNMALLAALLALTAFILYYLSEFISRDHRAIAMCMDGLTEAITDQNYILLADDRERSEFKNKLKMPPSLRKKLAD